VISEKHELKSELGPRRHEPEQYGNMVKRNSAKKNLEAERLSRVRLSNFIGVVINPESQGLLLGGVFEQSTD
jgi:hypothetical protein